MNGAATPIRAPFMARTLTREGREMRVVEGQNQSRHARVQDVIYKMIITKTEQPVDNSVGRPPSTPITRPGASKTPRVLALDPGTGLMGVAVFIPAISTR